MTTALHPSTPRLAAESDERLICRYRDSADIAAFETLVHRYERPLYRYLSRYLRSATLAEEVFAATFFRIHEKCGLYCTGRRFRPWLYSIATHQAIDALRREKRHRAVSLSDDHGNAAAARLLELVESGAASSSERLEQRERAEWAHQAVDKLADELRVVILLIFFQHMKYREAAETLDLPLGTVKSRVHKALLQLNSMWREDHAIK